MSIVMQGDRSIEEMVRDLLIGVGQTPNRATVSYLTKEITEIVGKAVTYTATLIENKEIIESEKKSGYLYGLCGHDIN